ncbi:MAG: hypothetical protein ABJA75_11515, partial [Bradyrhizobium sp.]
CKAALQGCPARLNRPASDRSGRRFHFQFGIEIGDDLLEGQNRGLNRGDLHQFQAADRSTAVLQRYDQIPSLFLKLNKR